MKKKVAVVLFNLGGPDKLSAVKPFLFNLFYDPAIISVPRPLRYLLAKFISTKREKTAREIYSHLGGRSPILELTKLQAKQLEKMLEKENDDYRVFVSMRYWRPLPQETLKEVINWAPDESILLPLYPQYSSTTSGSSLYSWKKETEKQSFSIPTKTICCYPESEKFILAHVKGVKKILTQVKIKYNSLSNTILLFSAHGLPEKIIKSGDPYQAQVESTVKAIVEKIEDKTLNHIICYQSKVGPLRWIGPPTEEEIIKASRDKKNIIIVPIAFVSEHSETLVELDIEYKKIAKSYGCLDYYRVPALGTNVDFIEALSDLVKLKNKNKSNILNKKICSKEYKKCFYNVREN